MRLYLAALLAAASLSANAQGTLERIPTRPGISVSLFWEPAPEAKATVLLFTGGRGGMGAIANGRPTSGNFLIRALPHFIENGLDVAVFGLPSDESGLEPGYRLGPEHAADMRAVIEALHRRTGRRVWLVGTSRGTTSLAGAATALADAPIAGFVFSSSITNFRETGAVANRDLSGVRVPVLVVHHAKDECRATRPHEADMIVDGARNAPVRKLVMAQGGADPRGDPCGAFHWHGFIGMEREAAGEIAAFVKAPAP